LWRSAKGTCHTAAWQRQLTYSGISDEPFATIGQGYAVQKVYAHAYLAIGLFPLGMWQGSLRSALGELPALAAVIGYLLFLRFFGSLLVRIIDLTHRRAAVTHNQAVDAGRQRRKQK